MGLPEIADQLYALTPDEFTQSRNDEAKRAKDGGDRDLSAAVRALRKPSTSAWLVNAIVRQHPAELDDLFDLGGALRAAHEAMAAGEIRRLSRQRHEVIRALTAEAHRRADGVGQRVTDAVEREVAATLEAALADDAAAAAVRSGRLLRALTSPGLVAVDVSDAVALPDATPSLSSERQSARLRLVEPRPAAPSGARLAEARRAVAQARARLESIAPGLAELETSAASAETNRDDARARIIEAEQSLEDARTAKADADRAATRLRRARDAAARERDTAQRRLRQAESTLADLER